MPARVIGGLTPRSTHDRPLGSSGAHELRSMLGRVQALRAWAADTRSPIVAGALQSPITMTASCTALARVPTHGAPTYVYRAVANPITLCAMMIAIVVAAGVTGVAGAVVAAAGVASLCASLAWVAPVRREIDRHLAHRASDDRETKHLERLRPVGVARRVQYGAVRDLIASVEEVDPCESRRFELDALFDDFVRVAILHAHFERAQRVGGALPSEQEQSTHSERTRTIVDMRRRLHDQCDRRVAELADRLDAIEQLVRLVAQRVACPPLDDAIERELDRRVDVLDAIDDAYTELSA